MASADYYLDILNGWKKTAQASVDSEFEKRFEEIDRLIYNDTVSFVGTEGQRIEAESLEYLDQKLKEYHSQRLNSNTAEVKKESDKAIEEIKAHIDSLLAEK